MRRTLRPGLPGGPYLVVGLARSGAAAALALSDRGERVIGVDAGEPPGVRELADAGVEVHLGEDGAALLEQVNALVKSPGVPRQAPVIARALAEGRPVLGELELGWRLLSNEVIAVTGTNGKTTTVEWIGHIHRVAGLHVAVAGNVGNALSGLVGRVEPEATIVCEVSSFQLEDAVAFAPEAAVLLNITPDHLDRHGTFEAYEAAKLKLFQRQGEEDVAVLPADFEKAIPGRAHVVRWSLAELAEMVRAGEMRVRGRHNMENGAAAAAVCLARGIESDAVEEGLRTFEGVAHRLEEVARREGVVYVNDSKATNVASTLVALEAFAGEGIHLILGGQGKGQDFTPLRAAVEQGGCRAVYLIGEDAPAIAAALRRAGAGPEGGPGVGLGVRPEGGPGVGLGARPEGGPGVGLGARPEGGPGDGGVAVHECGDLEHALAAAAQAARPGEVVLLSPACASFDQFADYEARGERFRELVLG